MLPRFSLDAALYMADQLIDLVPTSAVKVGAGDFNGNGKPDVQLEVFFKGASKPFVIGPIDVPSADLKAQLRVMTRMLGSK